MHFGEDALSTLMDNNWLLLRSTFWYAWNQFFGGLNILMLSPKAKVIQVWVICCWSYKLIQWWELYYSYVCQQIARLALIDKLTDPMTKNTMHCRGRLAQLGERPLSNPAIWGRFSSKSEKYILLKKDYWRPWQKFERLIFKILRKKNFEKLPTTPSPGWNGSYTLTLRKRECSLIKLALWCTCA